MELTETDLKELKIKIGPRKKILNLINNYNNVVSTKMIFIYFIFKYNLLIIKINKSLYKSMGSISESCICTK